MPEINSSDYHDFVIKNGRLVGEFEQMYQKSKEIPWHQDDALTRLDCHLAATIMARGGPYRDALEIGAGLGFFARFLAERINFGNFVGTDIAATAVSKAQHLFPELSFKQLDIGLPLVGAWSEAQFDLVFLRGVIWYLVPQMDVVVANLAKLVRPGGKIFISQNFPPLDKPFVGKDVIPNPAALIGRFEAQFKLLSVCELLDRERAGGNDNWTMFMGQRS